MKTESYRFVDTFWSNDLGVPSVDISTPVFCAVQKNYNGVQMFKRRGKLIIASPQEYADRVQRATRGLLPDELFSAEWLAGTLGKNAEKILGPAEVSYADSTTFQTKGSKDARELSQSDMAAYRQLQFALTPKEQEDTGLEAGVFPAFGVFNGNELYAAANYVIWEPFIAHIHVATDPAHRRRGFASAAVRALATHAFDRGLVLQWRAVAWNDNSLAMARDLGFEHYSSQIYARCRA
jgi:RimJ/RimL family protein N-acetyltransferase